MLPKMNLLLLYCYRHSYTYVWSLFCSSFFSHYLLNFQLCSLAVSSYIFVQLFFCLFIFLVERAEQQNLNSRDIMSATDNPKLETNKTTKASFSGVDKNIMMSIYSFRSQVSQNHKEKNSLKFLYNPSKHFLFTSLI